MPHPSRLVIPARLDSVRHACDTVVEAAEHAGLDERAVYHCQMAVDEALTNIIEHGYAFQGDDRQIEVVCTTDPGRFLMTISDDSPAFNPLEHEAPDPEAPLDTREPGGWGIYFICRLMDDVTYRHADGRNHLTLTKHRPTGAAAAVESAEAGFPVSVLDARSAVIAPAGRLDSHSTILLEQTLNAQLQKGTVWLYIDMSNVDYVASSGLKTLVSTWRRARDGGGDVILSGLQPRLVEIFEMVGFDMLFQVFPDLDAALGARPQDR